MSLVERRCPSRVTRIAAGAGAPTRSPPAHAGAPRSKSPAKQAARPLRNARRAERLPGLDSKRIAHARTRRPARKQLEAVEVAVHRKLREGKHVQAGREPRSDSRADVRDVTRGVL